MRKFKWVAALAMLAIGSAASAEWRRAQTAHFILTIDADENEARDFATRLERFDAALRRLYSSPGKADPALRPITIYAFKNDLYNATCRCPGALAYYRPRTEGSFILSQYIPKIDRKAKLGGWSSQALLLHEYTHHFTFSNFPIAYPFWFQEGFAEFNANSSFEADGSIIIGYPANYRADGLKNGGDQMSMKQLLAPNQYGYGDVDMIYGRGWLLTHYLILNPKRSGQLAKYLDAMNAGVSSIEAAQKAFGDLKQLDSELDAYRKRVLFAPLRVPPSGPTYALMLDGVGPGYRRGTAMKAEGIAKRYPDDPIVQAQLAEIELLAERYDKVDEAADRALAVDPKSIGALVRKGQAAMGRANRANSKDPATWAAARGWFLKANRVDSNQVMPLYLYYTSFVVAKEKPTPNAVKALERAMVLAPESSSIALTLAQQMLDDGNPVVARKLLEPVAFSPHAPRDKNIPLDVIKLIDAGKIDEAKTTLRDKKKDGDGEN